MKQQIVDRTKKLAETEDAHIDWAASQIANAMTLDEISIMADEIGKRRWTATSERLSTGINNRTGIAYTEREINKMRVDMNAMIVSEISAALR